MQSAQVFFRAISQFIRCQASAHLLSYEFNDEAVMFFLHKVAEAEMRFETLLMDVQCGGPLRIVEEEEPFNFQLRAHVREQAAGQGFKVNWETPGQSDTTEQQCEAHLIIVAATFKDFVPVF